MRIIKLFSGIALIGLGIYFLSPIAFAAWSAFGPGHEEASLSAIVAGQKLHGWQVWLFFGLLALIGFLFTLTGAYILGCRKRAA